VSCSRPCGRRLLVFKIPISQTMRHRRIPRLWRGKVCGYKNINPGKRICQAGCAMLDLQDLPTRKKPDERTLIRARL
jgi:hypothetical protein